MQTSTLTCSRCTEPVDPGDGSCGRCGRPRMRAVVHDDLRVVRDDLRVDHAPRPQPARAGARRDHGIPPVIAVASVLLLLAAGVAVLALWLGFSGPGPAPAAEPSTSSSAGASSATSSAPSASSPSPSSPAGTAPPSPSPAAASAGDPLEGSASAQVPATSPDAVDGAGGRVGYAAANMLDGDPTTTWRMDGDGTGEVVTFVLDAPHEVGTVGLVNGYAKDDPATGTDRYDQTRRITRVTWTIGERRVTQDLRDGDRGVQTVSFPPAAAETITLRIDAVTAPGVARFDQTAISEVVLRGR